MDKKTLRGFSRKEIYEIAIEYASTGYEISSEYFTKKYLLTKGMFSNILGRAIIESIVDDDMVELIAEKAKHNATAKAGTKGKRQSEKKYAYLKARRKHYILSKDETIEITMQYVISELYNSEFAQVHCITTRKLNEAIAIAIVEKWVSDDTVRALKEKSYKRNSAHVEKFWEEVEFLRENNT